METLSTTQILLGVIFGSILAIYLLLRHKYSFWSSRGIPGPRPVPFLGHVHQLVTRVSHDLDLEYARKYGPLYGMYLGLTPLLMVSDADLIKRILVKDFHLFPHRKFESRHWNDKTFDARIEYAVDAQHWKRVRSVMASALNPTAMKRMFPLVVECVDQLTRHMDSACVNQLFHVQHTFGACMMDIIGRTVFSVHLDNLYGADSGKTNPYLASAGTIFHLSPLSTWLYHLPPPWRRALGIKLLDDKSMGFMCSAVEHILNVRRQEMVRNGGPKAKGSGDLMTLLLEAQKKENESAAAGQQVISDNDIIAGSFSVLLNIYDPANVGLSCLAHKLATMGSEGVAIQDMVAEEVLNSGIDVDNSSLESLYEMLTQPNKLPYLDAVINETLRHFPVVPRFTTRRSEAPYEIKPGVWIPKNTLITIPVHPLNFNEEYFPSPQLFNPQRWLDSQEPSSQFYGFIPFGAGPRICVGARFATIIMKLVLVKLLTRFRFKPTNETVAQIEYGTGQDLVLDVKSKIILTIERRQ